MTLLDQLSQPACWERFYAYKLSLACPKAFAKELRAFIDEKAYLSVCEEILALSRLGDDASFAEDAAGTLDRCFPLPRRAVISKMSSQKKRVVYMYPEPENTVLKLLTWLLLRRYDGLFSDELYSFRPGRTAKDAVRRLVRMPGIDKLFACKLDISNYFNSIPVSRLLPMLEDALGDDPQLLRFLCVLLKEPRVLDGESVITEQKGIMAGTPLSAFYANLYLRNLDQHFAAQDIPYVRYSDDVILFAESRELLDGQVAFVEDYLSACGLAVNPDKLNYTDPGELWTFLGFSYSGGTIDIAPATLKKLKGKIRRKARALQRWRTRNGLDGAKAAAAFIRIFNRKLLEDVSDNELSWARWFFPVINTTESLHAIDLYAQDCIRFLVSGRRTKARYNVRYEDLKNLGYRSLVHAYYQAQEGHDS